MRAKLLNASEEPRRALSNTDREIREPTRTNPKIENEEPILAKVLRASEEPR
jgi:hypothetical protein